MSKKKIYIRAGNGKDNLGELSIDKKTYEKDINLAVSLKLKDKLKNAFDIKMYREDDSKDSEGIVQVKASCIEANDWGADLYIVIHHNSFPAPGYEIITNDSDQGYKLSNLIANQFELINQNKDYNGIYYNKSNYEIKTVKSNTLIISFGSIANIKDFLLMKDSAAQDKEATAISNAIATYYNISLDASNISVDKSNSGEIIITINSNDNTNSDYEIDDSKTDIQNPETGEKPDIYDLLTDYKQDEELIELRKIDPNIPLTFKEIWSKGFIMDWALDKLENSKPDIKQNTYEQIDGYNSQYYTKNSDSKVLDKKYLVSALPPTYDDLKFILLEKNITDVLLYNVLDKNYFSVDNIMYVGTKDSTANIQYNKSNALLGNDNLEVIDLFKKWLDNNVHLNFSNKDDDGFIDTRENNTVYETLEYSTEDYNISGVGADAGKNISSSSSNNSMARSKIIAKAEEIVKKHKDGKAKYVLGGGGARPAGGVLKDSDGQEMYDCSIMVEVCYAVAGITMTAPSGNQYAKCQNGGFVSSDFNKLKKEGKPGDLLFMGANGSEHVAIYDGNGGNYAAHTSHRPRPQQIRHDSNLYGLTSWGRCKELVDADKAGGSLGTANLDQIKLPKASIGSGEDGMGKGVFIKLIAPACIALCKKQGQLLASVMIACACQESGYGTSSVAQHDNNLFGVKAYGKTNEYWDGTKGERSESGDQYRRYKTIGYSIGDHVRFLSTDDTGNLYAPIRNAKTAESQAMAYNSTPYAGDKSKGGQLVTIIRNHNLTQYDK